MAISEEFLDELIKHDFQSTKKGRGYTSLLVKRKQKGYLPTGRLSGPRIPTGQYIPASQATVLYPPAGVMDISKWFKQLTPAQQAAY